MLNLLPALLLVLMQGGADSTEARTQARTLLILAGVQSPEHQAFAHDQSVEFVFAANFVAAADSTTDRARTIEREETPVWIESNRLPDSPANRLHHSRDGPL
jgi:hypothetical protein